MLPVQVSIVCSPRTQMTLKLTVILISYSVEAFWAERNFVRQTDSRRLMRRKGCMKTKSSRFDRLVARYYPAVYSFAARLTDDPREAVALTREAFSRARKQLRSVRNQKAIATVLISAVIRAGLASV